nr:unnamed protein product [Callosobruchus analis]
MGRLRNYLVILYISGFLLYESVAFSKWVLELGDNFADLHNDGGYWLVKFYTPWCGYCKRMEPIWGHVVQALKNTHIRIGRIDCSMFPNIAQKFGVTKYPTIKIIKGDEQHTFQGDKDTEQIVNFALRMSGPAVEHITRPESMTNIKNMNQLFFMYVGERQGALWNTFDDIANKMQAHAFYYSTSPNIAKKHIYLNETPAVFVHKENSQYFYTVGEGNGIEEVHHLNASMHKWMNEERFETFMKITEGNIEEVIQTKKYIVLVVVEENKLQEIPKEMLEFRNMVESVIRKDRDKYHSSFQFGWTSNLELANSFAMETISLPYLMVLNSTTLHHHIPEDEPLIMTTEAIELFLERVYNQTAPVYGGNDFAVRLYRAYFRAKTTLVDRYRGNPVLTIVLLGLPTSFLSFILYSCICSDILDAEEEDEDLHEKRE